MKMENKGIDLGPIETNKNVIRIDNSSVEPRHSAQKQKRARSDSSLNEPSEPKKQRLNTPMAHFTGTDEENSFAVLPNEMAHLILGYVSSFDLLNCRLVNCQWNEISSHIIRGRDDITIHFEFEDGKFVQKFDHPHREKLFASTSSIGSKTLSHIVNCIQSSVQFPFTSYRFDVFSGFGNGDMRDFLTLFGKEIRSIEVNLIYSGEISENLRKLVFEDTPNLKILSIRCYFFYRENPAFERRLVESTNQLQLPKLEVLRTHNVYPKIIEAIVMSSVNLKSISVGRKGNMKIQDMQVLQRAGKLHCVKDVDLAVERYIIGQWLKCGPLQLRYLNLKFLTSSDDQQQQFNITQTVGQLLHSIKNTLQSLTIEPLEFVRGLVLPRFDKVKRLRLRPSCVHLHMSSAFLPSLFDWNDKFPNLKQLDIDFGSQSNQYSAFCQSLKTLPSVETLRITGSYVNDIESVMKITPNVKSLVIMRDSILCHDWLNSLVDFQAISKYLPKLENFAWEMRTDTDINRNPHKYNFDAAITGLPVNLCKKLAKKFRNKDNLSAAEVAKYHSKKSHTSILDLKGLKNFYVELKVIDEFALTMDEFEDEIELWFDPKKFEISKVSKFLGFDLLPDLKFFVHTVYYAG